LTFARWLNWTVSIFVGHGPSRTLLSIMLLPTSPPVPGWQIHRPPNGCGRKRRRYHVGSVADHRFLAEIWGRTQKWPVEPRSGQWGMPGEPAIRACAAVLHAVEGPAAQPNSGYRSWDGRSRAQRRRWSGPPALRGHANATALQFSTRSEMIDLRVLGPGCFGWTNRPDPRAVTATIPDDLWSELLRAAPEPGSR